MMIKLRLAYIPSRRVVAIFKIRLAVAAKGDSILSDKDHDSSRVGQQRDKQKEEENRVEFSN